LKEVSGSWFCDVFVATAGLPSALLILLAMFKQIQIRFVDLERITNWFYCIVYCIIVMRNKNWHSLLRVRKGPLVKEQSKF